MTNKTIFLPKKIALFTDIHFGKKNNSIQHNEDCLNFVKWFCNNVKKEKDITHIIFLGDWFENRNAINVLTMTYSLEALDELNQLNIPIFFIIGNHDLYHRENRKVFSPRVFESLPNITLINEPTVFDDMFLCPYLFKNEYPLLAKYNNISYWFGHFEFKNFIITGHNQIMEHGLDHTEFSGPKYIFSGHFHKRQALDNVIYIGNTFPMDYGDVGDDERGMTILNTKNDEVVFLNWKDCPKYRKTKLSSILDGDFDFPSNCRVKCIIDTEILYSEAQALRDEMTKQFNLREFLLEENLFEKRNAISNEDEIENFDFDSLNDAVIKMLQSGLANTTNIDSKKLIEIYNKL